MRRGGRRGSRRQPDVDEASDDEQQAAGQANYAPGRSRLLEKFWGDEGEDLDSWLWHVNCVATLERWNERRKVQQACVALCGRARDELRAATPDLDGLTRAELERILKARFGPLNPVAYHNGKLMTCKQRAAESATAFGSRFRQLIRQLHIAQENDALPD